MDEINPDIQAYLDSSVFLLKQIKLMLKNHNKMLSVTAMSGDVPSASMLLHNNVALSSIDIILGFEAANKAKDLDLKETPLPMEMN